MPRACCVTPDFAVWAYRLPQQHDPLRVVDAILVIAFDMFFLLTPQRGHSGGPPIVPVCVS